MLVPSGFLLYRPFWKSPFRKDVKERACVKKSACLSEASLRILVSSLFCKGFGRQA
jgi:hypothetical protein